MLTKFTLLNINKLLIVDIIGMRQGQRFTNSNASAIKQTEKSLVESGDKLIFFRKIGAIVKDRFYLINSENICGSGMRTVKRPTSFKDIGVALMQAEPNRKLL